MTLRILQWLSIIWGVNVIKYTQQSITGVTYRDHFDFEERYRDVHHCDPLYWHPLHMPEYCIKQYAQMVRSRVPRSKPAQAVRENISKKNTYKYHGIDPESPPSSDEFNSINVIPYNDLASPNQYNDLTYPQHYSEQTYSNQYPYNNNQPASYYNDWTSINNVNALSNQYYDPNLGNNLDAPVQHINVDDIRNGHHDDREESEVQNNIDDEKLDHNGHNQNNDRRYKGDDSDLNQHAEPMMKVVPVDIGSRADRIRYVELGSHGVHGDRSHYVDLGDHGHHGEYRDQVESQRSSHRRRSHKVSNRQKASRKTKKHKKRGRKTENKYNQESLELLYNHLKDVMSFQDLANDENESTEHNRRLNHRRRKNHYSRQLTPRPEHGRRKSRKHQKRAYHERDLVDYTRRLYDNGDYGLLYDYPHSGSGVNQKYDDVQHTSNNYNSDDYENDVDRNYNDLSREFENVNYNDAYTETQDSYIFKTSGSRRRPRQNFPQDSLLSDYVSPFSLQPVFIGETVSDDYEPVHVPIPGYQSPVQTMLHAIEKDVRSQPIAPQIGVLPFLGVSAIYHQPISQKSVNIIKNVAHSYQEAQKEQYKEMSKYFPQPLPLPFPLPDFQNNVTTINPLQYYPGQHKFDKLMDKIHKKIIENVHHMNKDGEKHKVQRSGSPQHDIFMRQL